MLSFPDTLSSADEGDRPVVVLEEGRGWVYAGTDIPAVGAHHVTLGEVVNPLLVGRQGETPEAVLLPLSTIIEDQRLNWALQAGSKLDGDDEPMFKVPWSVWQEHAADPVDAWLPECDATGLERSLATAEREVRFAKQAMDAAGALRHRLVVLAIRLGRSRRWVGQTLGLSTGRVQQLNDDPPSEVVDDVEDFLREGSRIAALLGTAPCPRDEIPKLRDVGRDRLDEVVTSMLALGLLTESQEGLLLTEDGRALIDGSDTGGGNRANPEAASDHERSSDAAR